MGVESTGLAKLFAAEENSDWGISQDMISALVIRLVTRATYGADTSTV